MKLNSLQVRLLNRLARGEGGTGGFTLIELIVVILIIGVLASISLPSFLNQVNRAKAAEAASYVGTINRAQQAYRLENNDFAESLAELAIGIPQQTSNFEYSVQVGSSVANAIAEPLDSSVPGMLGVAYVAQVENGQATTVAFVCRSDTPGETPPPYAAPPPSNQCPGGSTKL